MGLRELGYVEGKNMIIEQRWAEGGQYERLPALAAELLQMKMDVIVTGGAQAIGASQQATATVPIVMVRNADPVGNGFVASLARPGRNITGVTNLNADLSSKYLELLRAAVPKLSRVSVLINPGNPGHAARLKRIRDSEKTNSVVISPAEASTASQIESAFATMKQEPARTLIVLADSLFFAQRRQLAELAARHRLPAIFWTREIVDAGGLMSYGQNNEEHYYRAATYVDKILKGAKPAELPVEQPTKLELVINLKTAKSIGLTISQELLLRADKVVQ
jgi:putative ABC transport system substrate-binding protein